MVAYILCPWWVYSTFIHERVSRPLAPPLPMKPNPPVPQPKPYRFNGLRKMSIVILLLAPLISLILLILFITNFLYVFSSPAPMTYLKHMGIEAIYAWALWLVFSTIFIILLKIENPGIIILCLIPLFVTLRFCSYVIYMNFL